MLQGHCETREHILSWYPDNLCFTFIICSRGEPHLKHIGYGAGTVCLGTVSWFMKPKKRMMNLDEK